MSYQCRRCGAVWPDEFVEMWGRHEESQSYGRDPICVALVPALNAPPVDPRHSRSNERETPMEVCRGELRDSKATATREVTPL